MANSEETVVPEPKPDSTETKESLSEHDKMVADIEKAMDEAFGNEDPPKEVATDTAVGEESEKEDKPKEEEKAFSPDDALVERAVRAGLGLADIKEFTSKESAERILALLEKNAAPTTEKTSPAGAEDPAGGVDVPEIEDGALDELDPSIAELIKSQNAAIKALSAEISTLKKAGTSAEAKGFFESQYGALDEKVRSHVDAVKKTQLKQKFDLLEKGYKAAGEKVDRETIFKEAVSITLSDAVAKAASETKAAKVAARKSLVIAPAGGSPGTMASVGEGEYAEIIARLKEKGFK